LISDDEKEDDAIEAFYDKPDGRATRQISERSWRNWSSVSS